MKNIIADHKSRYPDMQIQDMVKLLYQSEFGNGHMVSDEANTLALLNKEYQTIQLLSPVAATRLPAVELIGGGFCRVYLNRLPEGLLLETLARIFVLSANTAYPDLKQFEEKLELLKSCVRSRDLAFNEKELDEYLQNYHRQGDPVVSHTETYRRSYHPAYRVIAEAYAVYLSLFADIDRYLADSAGKPLLVAIDGQCASGKTTLCELLRLVYDCNIIHMDDFFLRPEQRTAQRLAEVGGNVDYERFKNEVIEPYLTGKPFAYRVYDCSRQALTKTVQVPVKQLTVVEGAYSQHPYFGSCYQLKYCLTINHKEQRNRILNRNGTEMLKRFDSEWIPMEEAYLTKFQIRENSTVIIS